MIQIVIVQVKWVDNNFFHQYMKYYLGCGGYFS